MIYKLIFSYSKFIQVKKGKLIKITKEMDPKVADMKYNDLRQYAKDLGIANFNCPKPKKE